MSEQQPCWFCRRTDKEVSAFADIETPKEREIIQQKSDLTRSKTEFIQSAEAWKKGVPKEFKEFDFSFMTSHPDQFKSIRIGNGLLGEIAAPSKLLGEIADAKNRTSDWLDNLALVLRKGDGEIPGYGALSTFERADRELLSRNMKQFEAQWRRRIGIDGGIAGRPNGYQQGFEGLKLFDGLEFMIALGILYYEAQAQLLEMAKRREIMSKPKRGVSALFVSGYPPVPICSVCSDVMKEMGSRQFAVEQPVSQQLRQRQPIGT